MAKQDPFSKERMDEIFRSSTRSQDRVHSRESGFLEFKESFGWKSIAQYLRTCVAFANAKGGYIVFGVGNSPHIMVGLKGANLQSFEELDPDKMTGHFNDHFAPEIAWEKHIHEVDGKTFGLLHVEEARDKPVVCLKDAGNDLREGDIYYRYRGQTRRIKYPELRAILEKNRKDEEALWLGHLSEMAQVGIREVGILNLRSGHVSGPGGRFVIEESLLSQVAFIREGEFSETKGKPTLRLIGEVEPLGPSLPVRHKRVPIRGIQLADIVLDMMKREQVSAPLDYITQICHEDTSFLPVYYYLKNSGKSTAELLDLLAAQISRKPSKDKLVDRMKTRKTQQLPMVKSANKDGKKKKDAFDKLIAKTDLNDIAVEDMLPYLQAMRMMEPTDVKPRFKYLAGLLIAWFNSHYSTGKPTLTDNLRRAICWLDEAMFMEEVAK